MLIPSFSNIFAGNKEKLIKQGMITMKKSAICIALAAALLTGCTGTAG